MRLALLLPVILLASTTTSIDSLPDLQYSFANFTGEIDAQLNAQRHHNNLLTLGFSRLALTVLAQLIVTLREVASETWEFIEHFETVDEVCKEYAKDTFKLYVSVSEGDLKDCALKLVEKLNEDTRERFWPVSNGVQRWSTAGISAVLGIMASSEEWLKGDELAGEVQRRLDGFGDEWTRKEDLLNSEIYRFAYFAESTLTALEGCAATAMVSQYAFMERVRGLLYSYCLDNK